MGCSCTGGRTATRPRKWMVRFPDGDTRGYLSDTEAYAAAGAEWNAAGRQAPADAVWPVYSE